MKKGLKSSVSKNAVEIKLRNKFAAKIPEEMHGRFIQQIQSFNFLEEAEALAELWKLAYAPEEAIGMFGFTIAASNDEPAEEGELQEKLTVIQEDWISAFRNELRYQYTSVHKEFPTPAYPIPEECEEAFKALKNAEGSDMVIAAVCFDACYEHVEAGNPENTERSIFLLRSEKENFYFGGIRNIGFFSEEAIFLKPYATHLAAIIEALYENWKKRQEKNCPMSGLGQLLQERGFEFTEQEESSTADQQEASPAADQQATNDEAQPNQESISTPETSADPEEAQSEEQQPEQQKVTTIKTIDVLEGADVFKNFISLYQQKEEAGKRLEEAQREYDQTCQQLSGAIAQLSQMGFKMKKEEIPIKVKAISMILQAIAIMEN